MSSRNMAFYMRVLITNYILEHPEDSHVNIDGDKLYIYECI
jgi:hypothetical protein